MPVTPSTGPESSLPQVEVHWWSSVSHLSSRPVGWSSSFRLLGSWSPIHVMIKKPSKVLKKDWRSYFALAKLSDNYGTVHMVHQVHCRSQTWFWLWLNLWWQASLSSCWMKCWKKVTALVQVSRSSSRQTHHKSFSGKCSAL